MSSEFYLTKKLPPYIFAAIHQLKQEAAAKGLEIIDFGMGNPDSSPPQHVIDRLCDLTKNPKLYGYSVTGGIDELKESLVKYYQRRFGVHLEQNDETLVSIGAKEGITSLATAISSPDNYIIVASPSYPIHTFAFTISKSNIVHIKALQSQEFLKKFKAYVINNAKPPVAVIVNYPCNPTSQIATLDFYQELVDFCKKHNIYIISDIAYCEIYFNENEKPHSILEIQGAKDIAIEFSSVSKTYSMAGCRIGFAAGNKKLISALYKVKSYLDYGSFEPLQLAAVDAMSPKSDQYLLDLREKYYARALFLTKALDQHLGWKVPMPKASMFLWAEMPRIFQHLSSFDFCKMLIEKTGVALCAGSSFGENGEGYIRISLIHNDKKVLQAIERLKPLFNIPNLNRTSDE